jgi:hypothetical protein
MLVPRFTDHLKRDRDESSTSPTKARLELSPSKRARKEVPAVVYNSAPSVLQSVASLTPYSILHNPVVNRLVCMICHQMVRLSGLRSHFDATTVAHGAYRVTIPDHVLTVARSVLEQGSPLEKLGGETRFPVDGVVVKQGYRCTASGLVSQSHPRAHHKCPGKCTSVLEPVSMQHFATSTSSPIPGVPGEDDPRGGRRR